MHRAPPLLSDLGKIKKRVGKRRSSRHHSTSLPILIARGLGKCQIIDIMTYPFSAYASQTSRAYGILTYACTDMVVAPPQM